MPLEYNNERKISLVKFPNSFRSAPCLSGAADWAPNLGLSIITGVNGSGKSLLLGHLYDELHNNRNKQVLYLNSKDIISNPQGSRSGFNTSYPIADRFQVYKDEILRYFSKKNILDRKENEDLFRHLWPNGIVATFSVSDFSNRVIKSIEASNITTLSINDIVDHMNKTIEYEKDVLNTADAMRFLKNLFTQYRNRKKAIQENIKKEFQIWLLYEFASKETSDLDLQTFVRKVSNDSGFRSNIMKKYSDKCLGMSPLQEINKIVSKYNFKYRITTNDRYFPDDPSDDNFDLVFIHNNVAERSNNHISFDQLSSGEQMIIRMMTWIYYNNGLSIGGEGNIRKINDKNDIILLDEPDAHLDPKLLKVFMDVIRDVFIASDVQVIMTTHRMDTVALSRKDELFVIEQKEGKRKEIKRCHKMQALARLSRNTGEFTGFHPKVYTEAFDDALFYQNIYRLLLKSQEDGLLPVPEAGKLLSRRWIPQFQSICFSDGEGGGKTAIPPVIRREYAFYNNHLSLPNDIYPPKVHIPFAIIDDDWGEASVSVSQNLHQDQHLIERFSMLKRHSLENYLYDPFFLSSLLKGDEINKHVGNESIRKALLKMKEGDVSSGADEYFSAVNNSVEEIKFLRLLKKAIQGDETNYKTDIHRSGDAHLSNEEFGNIKSQIFQELKPFLLSEKMRTLIKQALDTKYDVDIICISVLIAYEIERIIKHSFSQYGLRCGYDYLCTKLSSNSNGKNAVDIKDKYIKKSQIPSDDLVRIRLFGYDTIKEYMYPKSFLLHKGHDIEDVFALDTGGNPSYDANITNSLTDYILNNLSVKESNVCIPSDLLEVMNELSNKIRRQINVETNKYNESRQNIETEVDEHLAKKTWVQAISSSSNMESKSPRI